MTYSGVNIHTNDTSTWAKALAAVDDADAVVLALGMDLSIGHEGTDSSDIGLPAVQVALALAVAQRAAGKKPVVLVLINGLPLSIDELVEPMDAIVEAYTPSFGARAVGAALFGANRWGRTITTIYPHNYQNQVRVRGARARASERATRPHRDPAMSAGDGGAHTAPSSPARRSASTILT